MTVARVPASSANLGPGFDALGMALSLHADVGVVDPSRGPPGGTVVVAAGHPAAVAFRHGGGTGAVWVRSAIPEGRGLGFSGAARVGGLVVAALQRAGGDPALIVDRRDELLATATALEGHADNVAASLIGGVVATAGGRAVAVPVALDPAVVVWVPSSTTSTASSRAALPADVRFADATFNVGRTALLVAALAAGDVDALRDATTDRLHQDRRLALAPASSAALRAGLAAGAWGGWLSGSGPSVALLCAPGDAAALAAALPAGGHVRHLRIDPRGVRVPS